MTNGSLMQYFWPVLSDNWSWKPIFALFKSGCFTQVLLYKEKDWTGTTEHNKIWYLCKIFFNL